MINKLDMQFPGIKDCIAHYYTSSSFIYRDYTATANGSLYGIAKDKGNPIQSRVSQRTKITNFYFTGQNIKAYDTEAFERVIAYGDSRGDREMLEFADEAHYRVFE